MTRKNLRPAKGLGVKRIAEGGAKESFAVNQEVRKSELTVEMSYNVLVENILDIHQDSAGRAAVAVDQLLVMRNWMIGRYLVEFEQRGADRATYGASLLRRLSGDLTRRGMKGVSPDLLECMRIVYQRYPQFREHISATLSRELPDLSIPESAASISGTVSRKSAKPTIIQLSINNLRKFSWSLLVELTRIEDAWKRAFYENECLRGNWSVRQLKRQIGSMLYERTGLSKDKRSVIEAAQQEEPRNIADLIREPYILEFTGLAEKPHYRESDLESALLDHLQAFLLELGTGFCFEARQKRITVGEENDYVDLVFYHRRLRCHVLLDLKVRAFKHADAGQMNFYLNYWKANEMEEGDSPPVGLILCSDRKATRVQYATAGLDHRLFVSRYLMALPSEDRLRQWIEGDRAGIEGAAPAQ